MKEKKKVLEQQKEINNEREKVETKRKDRKKNEGKPSYDFPQIRNKKRTFLWLVSLLLLQNFLLSPSTLSQ